MPEGLQRYYGRGHLHFITFSCYRRRPLLATMAARDVFVEELGRVRDQMDFRLIGYVVMPEHVHLLISEPPGETPSKAIQKLKQRVSRRLRKRRKRASVDQLRFAFDGEEQPAFWQARFYDFNVYTAGKKSEKLNYMHANPVIRKLVKHPKDWPWSSWPHYRGAKTGLIGIDSEQDRKNQTQDPLSETESGAPYASRYFRSKS